MISRELLNILACPACKGPLQADGCSQQLTCVPCKLKFQVKDAIPVMLVEETVKTSDSGPGTNN